MKRIFLILAVAVVCGLMNWTDSHASGTSSPSMQSSNDSGAQVVSLYDQGVIAGKRGEFKQAQSLFEAALKDDPKNPDILNMLAHAQRKNGLIDEALANYKKALELRPNFPEAREYLGEAYLQAALRELDTLKNYGKNGEEEVEDLTKDFKESAEKAEKQPATNSVKN